jgi:S-adenosylmethionine synthetase
MNAPRGSPPHLMGRTYENGGFFIMRKLFTSESVTEGHPDKVCDILSDSVLDAHLAQDPYSRVACECAATTGLVLVMGEITSKAQVDISSLVRSTVNEIGYTDNSTGFSGNSCAVLVALDKQSGDIAMGVDKSLEAKEGVEADMTTGAGDQGMMFGYATDETEEYMPLPIYLAHALTRRLAAYRKSGADFIKPDGKAQVSVVYENGKAVGIDTVLVSTQHSADATQEMLKDAVYNEVIKRVIPENLLASDTRILVNPTGRFVIGGPHGDSGLTGRKIIVDTYGGLARHGGGAFSGKDPTKVDRSAAYAARYIAKNIVAAGLAKRCELQIAYAIGVAEPVSVFIDTFGTGTVDEDKLLDAVRRSFDLRPEAIIRALDLRRPIYRRTAAYGHFGDPAMPWEQLDLADKIKANL